MNDESKRIVEAIESAVYKNADDLAIALSRSFERLEERIDAMETRVYTRIAELEDMIIELKNK